MKPPLIWPQLRTVLTVHRYSCHLRDSFTRCVTKDCYSAAWRRPLSDQDFRGAFESEKDAKNECACSAFTACPRHDGPGPRVVVFRGSVFWRTRFFSSFIPTHRALDFLRTFSTRRSDPIIPQMRDSTCLTFFRSSQKTSEVALCVDTIRVFGIVDSKCVYKDYNCALSIFSFMKERVGGGPAL